MEEKKQKLVKLILEDNISAIITLSERIGSEPNEVIYLIKELQSSGKLVGSLTEDGSRFFKSSIRVSSAPAVSHDEHMPNFLSYNASPWKIMSLIGFIALAIGLTMNVIATNAQEQFFAAILVFIGLLIFIVGLYRVTGRPTPD